MRACRLSPRRATFLRTRQSGHRPYNARAMATPRVSVLMPAFNAARFIGEAIESILSQDYRDFELLIVDDASTDQTPSIVAHWAGRDPRIAVVRNAANLGVSEAGNVGLRAARGEYVARQDADDLSLPGRLSAEAALLDSDPSVSMVSMNYQFIDEHGTVLRTERRDHPPEVVDFILHFANAIGGHSQVMFRRELALRGGGYDPGLTSGEDYELWTRLARLGRIVVLPALGMRYRLHGSQVSATNRMRSNRRWIAFSGGLLSRYLAREVGEDEVEAAIGAWRGSAEPHDVQLGLSVIAEAFSVFAARYGEDPALIRRLREVIAARLATTALTHLHGRRVPLARRYFAAALRWGIVPAVLEPPRLFAATLVSRRRRRLSNRRVRASIE